MATGGGLETGQGMEQTSGTVDEPYIISEDEPEEGLNELFKEKPEEETDKLPKEKIGENRAHRQRIFFNKQHLGHIHWRVRERF